MRGAFKGDAMNLRKDIKPITNLKTRAVVQYIASYEATRKTLLLLKLVAQREAQICKGKWRKQAEVFLKLEKRFARNA